MHVMISFVRSLSSHIPSAHAHTHRLSPQERTALLAACLDLRRSFARVLAFIRAEYAPRLRPDAGFSSLPSGAAGCGRVAALTASAL